MNPIRARLSNPPAGLPVAAALLVVAFWRRVRPTRAAPPVMPETVDRKPAADPTAPAVAAAVGRQGTGRPNGAVIAACLAVTAVLAVQVAAGIDSPARPLLSVAFYLAVPGWAVVGWIDQDDKILSWTLAIGLSVAIGILTAEGMLWAHAWNPDVAFACLALLAAVLLGGQAVQVGRNMRLVAQSGGQR